MALDVDRVREIADRVAASSGLEVVEVEFLGGGKARMLRVFLDKPAAGTDPLAGVTHEDCAKFSREFGTILDVEDVMPGSYTLEVSSPGLERGLYKRGDFERFAGSRAKMKTRNPIGGQRNFRGRLIGVDGDEVLFEDSTSGRVRVPLNAIAKANLEIDFNEEFRRTQLN